MKRYTAEEIMVLYKKQRDREHGEELTKLFFSVSLVVVLFIALGV